MALTYLKETEGAYPNRLVSEHFPLVSSMPRRKFNMGATFTPTTTRSFEDSTPPATQPPHSLDLGTSGALIPSFDKQPQGPIQQPLSTGISTGAYSPANISQVSYLLVDARNQCSCPSRRVEVLNLPPSKYSIFAELLKSVGDVEHEPQYITNGKLSVQFYDLRSAQKLCEVLPTISMLAGVIVQNVILDSDVSVLIDIPWGHNVDHSSLLRLLKQHGSVATLMFGKPLIGGPQQAICIYNDIRDATSILNNGIIVNGRQLPIRVLSMSHTQICPTTTAQQTSRNFPFVGAGTGTREPSSLPAKFSTPVSSITPLASPYSSNSRTDASPSYFPSTTEGPWVSSSTDSPTAHTSHAAHHHKAHADHALPRLGHHNMSAPHMGHTRHISQGELDVGMDTQHLNGPMVSGSMAPGSRNVLEPVGSEIFRKSYTPIGRVSATTTDQRFETLLGQGPFGSGTKHESLHQIQPHLARPSHRSLGALDTGTLFKATGGLKLSESAPTFEPLSQDAFQRIEIPKKYAEVDGKTAEVTTEVRVESGDPKYVGNDINLETIANGSEQRTTVMLRNIPNKLDFKDLKRFLDVTNRCTYDFLYLRFDFTNRCNVGYAFISFTKPKHVATFVEARAGMKWSQYNYNSEKVIEIKFARIQGRDSLIQKFRNSPVMSQDPAFKPRLYYTKGKLSGKEEPFPEPTGKNS